MFKVDKPILIAEIGWNHMGNMKLAKKMILEAKQNGAETKFIELSGKINRKMPTIIFKKVLNHLKKIKDPKILILGLSYKKNIDDARESPSFELMKLFHNKKIKIDYHDKYFSKLPKMRNYNLKMKLTIVLVLATAIFTSQTVNASISPRVMYTKM